MRTVSPVILYAIFFLLCFLGTGTDTKNIRSFYSYPDRVQKLLIESGKFEIPKNPSYAKSFLRAIPVFAAAAALSAGILKLVR